MLHDYTFTRGSFQLSSSVAADLTLLIPLFFVYDFITFFISTAPWLKPILK